MQKFVKTPFELFRLQTSTSAKLREYTAQKKLGRTSYDLKLDENGMVAPCKGIVFECPNGMSLRPMGPTLFEIAKNFIGKVAYRIPKETDIPSYFSLYLEHSDHFSLQTSEICSLIVFNKRLQDFLETYGEKMSWNEFMKKHVDTFEFPKFSK